MSKLSRTPWQIHIMKDPEDSDKLKVQTNNFTITGLDIEELAYAVTPFVGCPGKCHIDIRESIGTEEERKALFEHVMNLFDTQRRATGFLTPVHSALHTYWYNVLGNREKYDVRGLKNILKGRPVLYLGAGPSLKDNVQTIKKIIKEDLAFVITGGTGIKVCHDAGIVPHLCLAVDPFMQEVERFEGLSTEWQQNTLLLASTSLNPYCYNGWEGKLIAAEGLNCMPVGEIIEGNIETLDEGPVGVTTWMLNIVEYMGANEIVLVGTDLCFGKGGETYAGDLDLTASQCTYVECEGKATKTNWVFEANYMGKVFQEKQYAVVNCSKGLRIPNTVNGNLKTVIKSFKSHKVMINLTKWNEEKSENIRVAADTFSRNLRYTEDNLGDPDIKEQAGYKYLIKSYDDIQEYQYWRTGMYNYSLIREVCRKNADLIESILEGEPYDGDLPYGHLGSPQTPGGSDKIQTGSKHAKET